jgi:hypothetical protein
LRASASVLARRRPASKAGPRRRGLELDLTAVAAGLRERGGGRARASRCRRGGAPCPAPAGRTSCGSPSVPPS